MKKTFLLLLTFYFWVQQSGASIAVHTHVKSNPKKSVAGKYTPKYYTFFKLFRAYKKKNETKTASTLGVTSLVLSLASPVIALLAFTSASPGIFVISASLLACSAIITGLLSLKKRKHLSNKKGTNKGIAMTGIILGALFILIPLLAYLIINN